MVPFLYNLFVIPGSAKALLTCRCEAQRNISQREAGGYVAIFV